MKASRIAVLFLICITLSTGCDAIRSALGKPTSKDLAALRLQKQQMQHNFDSLAIEMGAEPDCDTIEAVSDSLPAAVEEPVAEVTEEISEEAPAAPEYEIADNELAKGFYVVVGSFKNEDNARYLYNSLSASGNEAAMVRMKNGFTAVMICRGDSQEEAYRNMREFYGSDKHPEDIWIYNTDKKMHVERLR